VDVGEDSCRVGKAMANGLGDFEQWVYRFERPASYRNLCDIVGIRREWRG